MKKVKLACVIDDDEIYTFAVKRVIEGAKFAEKTLFFNNGQVALDFFEQHVTETESLPDLILLDLNMPVLDGWQFLEEFNKLKTGIGKEILVYIVSSSVDDEDFNRAKEMGGISDFLVKPLTAPKLHGILESLDVQTVPGTMK
jgi:CheY-like chemotaxis protein